jgi:hypothetical protein
MAGSSPAQTITPGSATLDFVGTPSPSCPINCVSHGYNAAWDATGAARSHAWLLTALRVAIVRYHLTCHCCFRPDRLRPEEQGSRRSLRDLLRHCGAGLHPSARRQRHH